MTPVVAVVGATASGKTTLSLDLAEALGGEIINTDAMQFYRGMDIGTAKLPAAERRGIPHHLLDWLDVTEPASVADFQQRARGVIADIRGRGAPPVLVGGSALYTRAVLDHFEFPGTDESVRARWEAELERIGAPALHAMLRERDPEAAADILPDNGRRIVRALEVVELTGERFSATLPAQEYVDPLTIQIGIDIPRDVLDARIEQRVDAMVAGGWLDEVRSLLDLGLREGRTASRAIGYRELVAHLDGELSLVEARERTVSATRRFVRRQESWFRRDQRIVWLPYDSDSRVQDAVAAVRSLVESGETHSRRLDA